MRSHYQLLQLKKELEYNPIQGAFYWIKRKQGRQKDKPAGHRHPKTTTSKTDCWVICCGDILCPAHHLVYAFTYGHWPTKPVIPLDGDYINLKADNYV